MCCVAGLRALDTIYKIGRRRERCSSHPHAVSPINPTPGSSMRTRFVMLAAVTCIAGRQAQAQPPAQQRPSAAVDSANAREAREDPSRAPNRREGDGPFPRLIIRGTTLIDGTGGPPRGPVDIVIENNRITNVASVGYPGVQINANARPRNATREIDGTNMYV